VSVPLSPAFDPNRLPALRAERQLLTLENGYGRPLLVRIERTIPQGDVLTAAQASGLALFRQLFPAEVLSRDRLSDYAACTLLAVRAVNLPALCETRGEAAAYLRVSERFREIRRAVETHGGRVVKEHDEQLLAAFPETLKALSVAAGLARGAEIIRGAEIDRGSAGVVELRVALHRGTALATSVNGRLDYFGRTVTTATGLLDAATNRPLVLSEELERDPEVIQFLESEGLTVRGEQVP
jgi:class 3 adenylate cyclase